jgi:hypothetical protein
LWITGVPVIEISVIENKKEIENSNFTESCPVKRYVKVWLISVKVLRNSCGADDTQTIFATQATQIKTKLIQVCWFKYKSNICTI